MLVQSGRSPAGYRRMPPKLKLVPDMRRAPSQRMHWRQPPKLKLVPDMRRATSQRMHWRQLPKLKLVPDMRRAPSRSTCMQLPKLKLVPDMRRAPSQRMHWRQPPKLKLVPSRSFPRIQKGHFVRTVVIFFRSGIGGMVRSDFKIIDSCQKLDVGKSLNFLSFSCSHTDVLSCIMYLVNQGHARRSEDSPHILEYLSKDPSTPHKSKAHISFQTANKKQDLGSKALGTIDGASDSGDTAGEQEDEDEEYVPEWHEDYDDDLDEDEFSYDDKDESENLESDSFIFEDAYE